MSSCNVKGIDKVINKLKGIQSRMEELRGKHKVPLKELFNSEFLQKHTKFNTLEEIANKSGLSIEKEEDLDNLKKFIVENSTFKSWDGLLKAASACWVRKKIGLT
jgi:hypothetical protein